MENVKKIIPVLLKHFSDEKSNRFFTIPGSKG